MKIQIMRILALVVSLCFVPINIAADTKDNHGWSYSIQNGIEKTKRTYLLVYNPQTRQERQITVVSQCSKPHMTEGTYGKCNHKIKIQPTDKMLSLDTGEDVVIVVSSFDSLILGTIDYGCCADFDTAMFYTETGSYLGRLTTLSPLKSRNNVFTDMFDFKNTTRHKSTKYLVIQDDKNDYKYYAWVKENKNQMKKIPVLFTIPNKESCDKWYLTDFTKYGDRQDITLTLEGRFCESQNRTFSCHKTENAINCDLRK